MRPSPVLVRRGIHLECATLGWNVVGIVVLGYAAWTARSVALGGFGIDSLIEIGASTVVIWELSGVDEARQHRALRLIGIGFLLLAAYLAGQGTVALARGHRAHESRLGIGWTAATAVTMAGLAAGKARTGTALDDAVLRAEGRVTLVDAILAATVLLGLLLDTEVGWWWADPLAGYVLVLYAIREARHLLVRPPA